MADNIKYFDVSNQVSLNDLTLLPKGMHLNSSGRIVSNSPYTPGYYNEETDSYVLPEVIVWGYDKGWRPAYRKEGNVYKTYYINYDLGKIVQVGNGYTFDKNGNSINARSVRRNRSADKPNNTSTDGSRDNWSIVSESVLNQAISDNQNIERTDAINWVNQSQITPKYQPDPNNSTPSTYPYIDGVIPLLGGYNPAARVFNKNNTNENMSIPTSVSAKQTLNMSGGNKVNIPTYSHVKGLNFPVLENMSLSQLQQNQYLYENMARQQGATQQEINQLNNYFNYYINKKQQENKNTGTIEQAPIYTTWQIDQRNAAKNRATSYYRMIYGQDPDDLAQAQINADPVGEMNRYWSIFNGVRAMDPGFSALENTAYNMAGNWLGQGIGMIGRGAQQLGKYVPKIFGSATNTVSNVLGNPRVQAVGSGLLLGTGLTYGQTGEVTTENMIPVYIGAGLGLLNGVNKGLNKFQSSNAAKGSGTPANPKINVSTTVTEPIPQGASEGYSPGQQTIIQAMNANEIAESLSTGAIKPDALPSINKDLVNAGSGYQIVNGNQSNVYQVQPIPTNNRSWTRGIWPVASNALFRGGVGAGFGYLFKYIFDKIGEIDSPINSSLDSPEMLNTYGTIRDSSNNDTTPFIINTPTNLPTKTDSSNTMPKNPKHNTSTSTTNKQPNQPKDNGVLNLDDIL